MSEPAFVTAARRYIGTPFHHQARQPGVGLDCVGVLICAAREVGALPHAFDYRGYTRQPGTDGTLLRELRRHFTEIDRADMAPGDVIAVAYRGDPQHVGILSHDARGRLCMIHAAWGVQRVTETRLLFSEAMQFVAAFRLPDREPGA